MLIVTYHAIDDRRSPVSTSVTTLRDDLLRLQDTGFAFVSLDTCAAWLAGAAVPPRLAVAITFDDAYASVVRKALPVLTELGVPATVFVISGLLGRENDWEGQWASIPRMPLADAEELRELCAAGITIGAHSRSHESLHELSLDEARNEIAGSGDALEHHLGVRVRHFAYPYGNSRARDRELARQRYDTAATASPGLVESTSDPYELPRLDAHDLRLALRLGLTRRRALGPYLGARRNLRRLRRQVEGWW